MSIEAMKRVVEAFDALPPYHPARYANLQINLLRTAIQQATQPAEVTDEQILKTLRPDVWMHVEGLYRERMLADARAILALRPVQSTFCEYCGGNDEEPVDHCMDCTRPVQVPMNQDEVIAAIKAANISSSTTFWSIFEAGIRAAEAHQGITAQAKKGVQHG